MKQNRFGSRHLFLAAALTGCFMSAAGTENAENTAGAPAEPTPKAPGIGDVAKQLIRDGLGNKEVLDAVKAQFPEAKTTMSSINWYRNHLRDTEDGIKTARELSNAGKPSAAEAKAAKDAKKAEEKAAKDAKKAEEKAAKDAKKAEEKAAKKEADKAAKEAAKVPAGDAADLDAALG